MNPVFPLAPDFEAVTEFRGGLIFKRGSLWPIYLFGAYLGCAGSEAKAKRKINEYLAASGWVSHRKKILSRKPR